jgi:hypothetical protein
MNNKDLARQVVQSASFGKTNSAYPGQNMGLSLEQVKNLVDNAKKVQGVTFISIAGTTTPNVQLPATAKMIKGIVFAGNVQNTDSFDLLINEEKVVSTGAVQAYQANTGKPLQGYFELARPVASSTAITLNYVSTIPGNNILFQVVYM